MYNFSKSSSEIVTSPQLTFPPNDNSAIIERDLQKYTDTSKQLDTACTSITERKKTIITTDLAYKLQHNKKAERKNELQAINFVEKLTKGLGSHYLSANIPENKLYNIMILAIDNKLVKANTDIKAFIQSVKTHGENNDFKAIAELLMDITEDNKYIEECYLNFHHFSEYYKVRDNLEAVSLSLYWMYFIATSDNLYLSDVSFFVNNLTFYCFKSLGLDPYILFKLPDNQLLFICTVNKLLAENIVYQTWAINLKTSQEFPNILTNHIIFLWGKVLPKIFSQKDRAIEFNNPIDMFSSRTKEILLGDFLTTTIINCIQQPKEEGNAITAYNPAEIYLFGDEFEYNYSIHSTYNSDESDILEVFYKELESHLTSLDVDFHITDDMPILFTTKIGTFKFRTFMDCDNLEINPTPYKIDTIETVTINGELVQMTRYEAYDMFIFPIIEKLKFDLVSGHKHMDIRQLSPEIILRMLLTTNTESFLPVIYDRCENLKEYFPYLSEKNIAIIELLENIRQVFNENIASGNFEPITGSYEYMATLCHILSIMDAGSKYSALSTHHVVGGKSLLTDQELTDYNFNREPGSTIENRTYPCPRSGAEVRSFNKFCQANVTLEGNRQQEQVLISTELKKVTSPLAISKEDAVDQFIKSLTEKQLDPTEFKDMIRV